MISFLIVVAFVQLIALAAAAASRTTSSATSDANTHHRHHHHNHKSSDAGAEALKASRNTHSFLTDPDARWWMLVAGVVVLCVIAYCFTFVIVAVIYGTTMLFSALRVPFSLSNRVIWTVLTSVWWLISFLFRRVLCCCFFRGSAADAAAADEDSAHYSPAMAVENSIDSTLDSLETPSLTSTSASSQPCASPNCAMGRMVTKNGQGLTFAAAYCKDHLQLQHGPHATELVDYEKQPTKYLCNYRFLSAPLGEVALRAYALQAWREARMRNKRQPGFIYVFTSAYDRPKPTSPTMPFLYKIGETTLPTAAARVAQWDDHRGDVNFVNEEGVGWWPTKDAKGAEAIIHATLVLERVVRYNSQSRHEEVEWFHTTYGTVKATIESVIGQINQNNYYPAGSPSPPPSSSSHTEYEPERHKTVSEKTK
jgi:hypothetical protein